jgi:small-conductance mechanosensitive channel
VTTVIVSVGILSALLTIPSVRAIAGGVLASTAILGLILGLAAQKTLSNFVAGILIAVAQPFRLGDLITVDDQSGRVEEIGLTYTFIRLTDGARLVVPNDTLASDTIRNSTIRSVNTVAEIKVQVPLAQDVAAAVDALRKEIAAVRRGTGRPERAGRKRDGHRPRAVAARQRRGARARAQASRPRRLREEGVLG